jgi:5-methylcytosine-specific restriction endonuclease McrA
MLEASAVAETHIPHDGPIVTRAEARAAGLKRYFTGKTCKNRHLAQRTTADGACPDCRRYSFKIDLEKRRARQAKWRAENIEQERLRGRQYSKDHRDQSYARASKPASRVKKNATAKARYEKLKSESQDLLREKWRSNYKKNPKSGVERSLKWQSANQAALLQYRIDNADALKRRSAEWAKANPEKVRERVRRYQLAHPEKGKEWKKANPEKVRAIKQNRRARERNAEGRHTADELKALFIRQNGQCVYCKVSISGGYDADHIQPLAKGGSNWITNIQLLCGSCNSRKWAIDPQEFARRLKLKAA